jgi:hypothetical protein
MIVLLEYFPTSINTCIWNKLHASFYLKNVMIMSLFKKIKCCSKILHGGIVGWLSLFLMIRIMLVELQVMEDWGRELHKPPLKMEFIGIQRWSDQTRSLINSFWNLLSCPSALWICLVLCNVLGRSLVCGLLCLRDLPHIYYCTYLFKQKETK